MQEATHSPRGRLDKQDAILAAATKVFLRDGNAQASVADIAREAGVAKPTIYAHFGSKENLLLTVLRNAFDRVGAANFAALDSLPDRPEDLEHALLDFSQKLVRNIYRDPDTLRLRRFLRAENVLNPQLAAEAREHDRPQRDRLADVLAGRLARLAYAGYLKLEDPDRAARQFLALVTYDTQRLDEGELTQALKANVRFFLRGYAPEETESFERAEHRSS
jgi:TetR/AcrR family transcriptional repressor of mexJK operon